MPGKNLFVFGEEALLQVRSGAGLSGELKVRGHFRARRVPCREADLVIHLTPAAMSRLLSCFFTLARKQR